LKRAISGLIFILLLVFYYSTKITLGVLFAFTNDRFQYTDEISHFIKALRLQQLRVNPISRFDGRKLEDFELEKAAYIRVAQKTVE